MNIKKTVNSLLSNLQKEYLPSVSKAISKMVLAGDKNSAEEFINTLSDNVKNIINFQGF